MLFIYIVQNEQYFFQSKILDHVSESEVNLVLRCIDELGLITRPWVKLRRYPVYRG